MLNFANKDCHLNKEKMIELIQLEQECPGLLSELYGLYCTETESKIRKMKHFSKSKDYVQVAKLAHNLVSTCYNVAAIDYGRQFKNIENTCLTATPNDHDIEDSIELVEELSGNYRDLILKTFKLYSHELK